VTEDDSVGILVVKLRQQRSHALALRLGPRVAGIAEGIETALIADADGVMVVVLAVGTHHPQRPPLMYLPVACDIVMVSNVLPSQPEVVGLALVKAVALRRARRAAMQHYQCDLSHFTSIFQFFNNQSPHAAGGGDRGDNRGEDGDDDVNHSLDGSF